MYNTGNHYDLDPEHSAIIDSQTRARIDQATATSTTFASTAQSVATQAITNTVQTAQGVASAYPEIETILMKALKTEQPMTVRVSLIFALAVLLLISFAFGREMTQFFKAQVSETTSEVASSVLGDEATQRSTSEFSKAVIAQVLEDEATRKRLMAFLEQTLTSDDTAKILQGVVAGVLQSEATRKELYDLIMDPYTQKVLLDLVLWLFQQESTTRDLSKLVVSLLADEWFKEQGHEMLVQLLMGVVQDPRVMQATLKSLKDMVQDQSLQQSTGSALWSAVATPFLPSTWLRGKAREASDQGRAVENPREGEGGEAKGAVSDATRARPGTRGLRQATKPESAATQDGTQQKPSGQESKRSSPLDAPVQPVDWKKETGTGSSVVAEGAHSHGQPGAQSSPPASRARADKRDRAAGELAASKDHAEGSTARTTTGTIDDKPKPAQADAQPSASAGTAGPVVVKSAQVPPARQSINRKAEQMKVSVKGAPGVPKVERGESRSSVRQPPVDHVSVGKTAAEGAPDSEPSAASQGPQADSAAETGSTSASHPIESLTEEPSADTEHTMPEVQSRDEIEVAVFGDEPAEADESTDASEPEITGGNSQPDSRDLESPPSANSPGDHSSSIARLSEGSEQAALGMRNSIKTPSKQTLSDSGSAVPSQNQRRAGRPERYSNGGDDGAATRTTSDGSMADADPAATELNSVSEPRVSLSGDRRYGSVHETRTYPTQHGGPGRLRPAFGLQEEFQRGIGTIGSMVDSIQDEKIKRGIGRIGSVVGKIQDAAKDTVASVRQQSRAPSAGSKAAPEHGSGAKWEPDLPTEFLDVSPNKGTGAEGKGVGRQPVPRQTAAGSKRLRGATIAQGARSIPSVASGQAEQAAGWQRQ